MDGSTVGEAGSSGCRAVAIGGVEVPVGGGRPRSPARPRPAGAASEAGAGLLIPRCSSVHTFGMRFALDLVFLDSRRRPLAIRRRAAAPRASPRGAARPPCSSCRRPQRAGLRRRRGRVERSLGWVGVDAAREQEIASVVVCEDDAATLELLCDHLAADRFGVLPAPSASDALRLCRYNQPDLLLLDLALPDASGLDVLREIREADGVDARFDPRLPVIVLTGRGADTERVRGLELGADDYLVKPFHYPGAAGADRRRPAPPRAAAATARSGSAT